MADTPALSDTATLASLNNSSKRKSVNQVDIRQAEAEFTQLQRTLSRPSYDHNPQPSNPKNLPKDLEKAFDQESNPEEQFDLREYLTSSNDANQAAGIKHKHVGVTWQDLEVTGIGGEDNKECFTFYPSFAFPRPLIVSIDLCSYFP